MEDFVPALHGEFTITSSGYNCTILDYPSHSVSLTIASKKNREVNLAIRVTDSKIKIDRGSNPSLSSSKMKKSFVSFVALGYGIFFLAPMFIKVLY